MGSAAYSVTVYYEQTAADGDDDATRQGQRCDLCLSILHPVVAHAGGACVGRSDAAWPSPPPSCCRNPFLRAAACCLRPRTAGFMYVTNARARAPRPAATAAAAQRIRQQSFNAMHLSLPNDLWKVPCLIPCACAVTSSPARVQVHGNTAAGSVVVRNRCHACTSLHGMRGCKYACTYPNAPTRRTSNAPQTFFRGV